MDSINHIIAGGGIGGLGLLILAVRYQLQKDFVNKENCHQAQDAINQRIDDLKDHINTRLDDKFSDLKCYLSQQFGNVHH